MFAVKNNKNQPADMPHDFSPHPCLAANVRWAVKWIKENESDIPEGVRVMITSGHETRLKMLTFMHRPSKEVYGCGFANHVNLNQTELVVFEATQKLFDFYKKLAVPSFYHQFINREIKV